ncbi:uncharacterized protein HMPREF1541_09633 [Cyphellophora europaea CBS 101466]|uniref:GmrSD restriction endonucleases C-terminal domain-containing protein n=1 Tax=Cyphellophora europaea (strain CBS 101466) TaxID=1220924 RepID=W2SAZ5_CYPE1|nr:uncharacterized protein HMPREF1541_09633 [Cyphellophora europaea CBS 101466]ETN45800.1 hypothetical protein HMPREF1541_09633 [Cyphellophora europaea CBS 101466]
MQLTTILTVVAGLANVALALPVPAPLPAPPGIPSASSARSSLSGLTVRSSGSMTGYSRDEFPHWISSGGCSTRETVLARDGSNVVQDSSCAATSGTWRSPYDGATQTSASDIDIDHMVPLANAWISGANSWTEARRREFANDLNSPQLWAVTASVNRAKSDSPPNTWKPPLTSFHCTYARGWIAVKAKFGLSVTSAESSALGDMLDTC